MPQQDVIDDTAQIEVVNDTEIEVDSDESTDSEGSYDNDQSCEFYDELCQSEDEEQSIQEVADVYADIPKHMKCIAHILQLILKDTFESDPDMKALKKVS